MLDIGRGIDAKIIKGAGLRTTLDTLIENFFNGGEIDAKLINNFFDQPFFTGEESLINKLTESNANLKFEDIKEEGLNLALLQNSEWGWSFYQYINNLSDAVKFAIVQAIHNKVETELGTAAPYTDFNTECTTPNPATDPINAHNPLAYLQKINDYLESKKNERNGKQPFDILSKCFVSNDEINSLLGATDQIPTTTLLSDASIPANTKSSFDKLLSFEIGKSADRMNDISNNIVGQFEGLFSNTLPAINTFLTNNDYKYEESACNPELYPLDDPQNAELKTRLENINNNHYSEDIKKEQVTWAYYIEYIRQKKNSELGKILGHFFDNNFDYSKLEDSEIKYLTKLITDINLRKIINSEAGRALKLNFGNLDQFKEFYTNLADLDVNEIVLDSSLGLTLPVQKTIEAGENGWLNNFNEYIGLAKSSDSFPITYTLKKSDINNLNISIEDRTTLTKFLSQLAFDDNQEIYTIKGNDIGKLIYLFFIVNSRLPINEIDLQNQKKVEDVLGIAKQHEGEDPDPNANNGESSESNSNEGNGSTESGNSGSESDESTDTPMKFIEEMESLGNGTKFEVGSELWIPFGHTELPGGGYQWMKIKLTDINVSKGTFSGKIEGGELKFSNKLEGKSEVFKMNKSTFESFKELSKESDKILLLPNPHNCNFTHFQEKLNGKLGKSMKIDLPTRDSDHFIQTLIDKDGNEKKEVVKYFGAEHNDACSYKIKYNPAKRSFNVSTTYIGDEQDSNKKDKGKVKYSYERDMDWNNFLIFITDKQLIPQTEQKAKESITEQAERQNFKMSNGKRLKLNWFSISTLKGGIKSIIDHIKGKVKDYNKAQQNRLEDILIGDRGLYDKLAGVLGFIPSFRNGLGELQQEYYNERDNRARKEIETYLKSLKSDPDFGTTFDQTPPHLKTLWGSSYKEFILNASKKAELPLGERRKLAALLLANIESGGSPYRGLVEEENSGLWVKLLLGQAHYKQFLRDKQNCIADRNKAESGKNTGLDKKGLNETLASCEMKYIVNNIKGAYGKLPYFGSHENRGIDGDDNTNYIDNPSKKALSDQFAGKLESAYQGWFSKSSVEEQYSKRKNKNSFEEMEDDFTKMGSARYHQGLGALRRMFDLASDDSLKRRAKKHFLTYLLSGTLDIYPDPGLTKQTYKRAKTIGFVPGMLARQPGVSVNVATLLDDATDGDFSRNVTAYCHNKDLLNEGINFSTLNKQMNARLTNDNMDILDNYFKNIFPTKDFSSIKDPSKRKVLEDFRKKLLDDKSEEIEQGLLENPTIVDNGLLSNSRVALNRMQIDHGEFKGNDNDDSQNMADFWDGVKKDIEGKQVNSETLNLVCNQFLNWFRLSSSQDKQDIYKWINTACYYKSKIDDPRNPKHGESYSPKATVTMKKKGSTEPNTITVNLGPIKNNELKQILAYGLEGAARSRALGSGLLPKELQSCLNEFQDFFQKAFDAGLFDERNNKGIRSIFEVPMGFDEKYEILNWSKYNITRKKNNDNYVVESEELEGDGTGTDFSSYSTADQKKIINSILNQRGHEFLNSQIESRYNALKNKSNILTGVWKLEDVSDRISAFRDDSREGSDVLSDRISAFRDDSREGSMAA